jgi:N-acetylglucosamine kinase-like BadF-type ATPase
MSKLFRVETVDEKDDDEVYDDDSIDEIFIRNMRSTTQRYILIADGGSSSVRWALVNVREVTYSFHRGDFAREITEPLNPTLRQDKEYYDKTLEPLDKYNPVGIYFFGSGCTPKGAAFLQSVLAEHFELDPADVVVKSDLVGAVRALWFEEPGDGICGIIGTGSIAARVKDSEIIPMPSLGFIMGDEGSGSWLGKNFLSDYFKRQMPASMRAQIKADYPELTAAAVIKRVYNQPNPNQYLASWAPELIRYRDTDYVQNLLREGFTSYLRRNVFPAAVGHKELLNDIRVAGTIASVFWQELCSAGDALGCFVSMSMPEPLPNIVSSVMKELREQHKYGMR